MDSSVANIKIKISGQDLAEDELDNLMSFKVNASLQASTIAKLTFFDDSAILQDRTTFDIGKEITIAIGTDESVVDIFKGDIIRMDYVFASEGADKIQIICYDGLYRLSKIWHSRAFVKMKLSAIATKMATEASLTGNKIEATTKTYEHLYQNNQSNLDFLKMHAKQIGYEVGIEDGGLFFKKARYNSKIQSNIVLEWGDSLKELSIKIDASDVLSEVVVSSWDPDTKKNVESKIAAGSEIQIASATNRGTSKVKSKLKSEAKYYRLDLPNLTAAEATEVAKAHLTQSSINYLKAEGLCTGEPNFKLGSLLKIKGVGKKVSGDYYITSFEHVYNKNGYTTAFEANANGTY